MSGGTIKFAYQIDKPIIFTTIPQEIGKFGMICIEQVKSDGFSAKYITTNHKKAQHIKLDDIVYLGFTKGDYSLTIYKRFIVSNLIATSTEKTRIPIDSSKNWTIITQVQHTHDGNKYLSSRLEMVQSEYFVTLDPISNSENDLKFAIVGYIAIEMSNDEFDNSIGEIDAYGLFYATFKTHILSSDGDHEIKFSKTINDLKSPSIIKVIKLNSIRNNLNVDSSNNIKFSPKHIFGNVEYIGANQHITNESKSIHQKCCFLDNYDEQAWNLTVHNNDNTFDNATKHNTFIISGIYIEDYKQVVLKRLCLSTKPIKNSSFIECYKKCKSSREIIYCPQTSNAIECLRGYIKPFCYINDASSLYIQIMNNMHRQNSLFFKKSDQPAPVNNTGNIGDELIKKVRNKLLPITEENGDVVDSQKNRVKVGSTNDFTDTKVDKIECVTGEWEEWGNCSSICYDSEVNAQLGEFEPFIKNELFEYRIRRRTLYFKSQNAECPTIDKSKCVGLKKCSEICLYRLNKMGEAIIFFWTEECDKLNLKLPTHSLINLKYAKLLIAEHNSTGDGKVVECKFEEIWSKCDAPCITNDTSGENKPLEYILAPNCAGPKSRSCTKKLKHCTGELVTSDADRSESDKKLKPTIYLDRSVFKVQEGGWVNEKTNSCHCQHDENEIVDVSSAEELYLSGTDKYLGFQTIEGNMREPRGFFSNIFPEYKQLDEIYPHNIDKSHTYLNSMASLLNGQFIEFPSTINKQVAYNMESMDLEGLRNYCATGSAHIKPMDDSFLNIHCDEIRSKIKLYKSSNGKFVINQEEYNNSRILCKVSCLDIYKNCAVRIDIFNSMKIINQCTKNLINKDKLDTLSGKCNFSPEKNPNTLLRAMIVHQSQDLCVTTNINLTQTYDPSFCQIICKKYYNICLYQHKLDLHTERRKCLLGKLNGSKRGEMIKTLCEFRDLSDNVIRGGGLVFCKSKPVDCKYSEWSDWSYCKCEQIINIDNLKSRSRKIISGGNNYGKPCLGNYENLNQQEMCNTLLQNNKLQAKILPSIPKDEFKAQQAWDLNSEIKRLVKLHYQHDTNISVGNECKIFLGQRGVDEFRLIIDIGKCSCPHGFIPCTLPQSVTQRQWIVQLNELCQKNPLAFILFKKSKFFDENTTHTTTNTSANDSVYDKCNIGWTNISSFHFTCLNMTFVRHDYEALKLLCTASGDTTFISCTSDKEWLDLQRKRILISAVAFLCAGMLLGICLVSFLVMASKQKRQMLANCSNE